MSGNSYQTYSVQRIGKQSKDSESARKRHDSFVRISIPERLGRKLRDASVTMRLPEQIIAGEAIARGYALLKS